MTISYLTLINQALERTIPARQHLPPSTHHLLHNINSNKFNGILFVDFRKAFDVIRHDLLLRKLSIYGVSSCTLAFLSSYLACRQTSVCLCPQQEVHASRAPTWCATRFSARSFYFSRYTAMIYHYVFVHCVNCLLMTQLFTLAILTLT